MTLRLLLVLLALGAWLVACPQQRSGITQTPEPKEVAVTENTVNAPREYKKPAETELKQRLNPMQWKVTQEDATEPPFQNEFWNHKEHGLYVDITSGEPLFSSLDKFDSGCGWPSFSKPLESKRVVERSDQSHGMVRTEVRSHDADSHLGHVFEDGPSELGGLRYCINSASLRFIPIAELANEGYGEYLQPFIDKGVYKAPAGTREEVILAGGCFWGMQELLREIPGVISTEVGYSGGNLDNATYEHVRTGRTGHAEAVLVVFDPSKLSLETLLKDWFFKMHDPTTPNRQGNDRGTQYRSAIFYANDTQRAVAEQVKKEVDASGHRSAPLDTQGTPPGAFWRAEDYHQDYLQKNPGGYTCHWLRD